MSDMAQAMHSEQELRFITTNELIEKTSLSRSKLYKLRNEDPDFPKPIKLGREELRTCQIRWVESEIDQWMTQRMATRG